MSPEQLRALLGSPEKIPDSAFSILQEIARLSADPNKSSLAHELVLRALEQRTSFAGCAPMLMSLVRAAGLFPYLEREGLSLKDSIAYEFHRPQNMPEDFVFHREQAEIYRRLLEGQNIILSAPTSFGKSRIIDALIAEGRFDNVVIIVPTLALIDETRRRLAHFSGDEYKVVTQLSQKPAKRSIFVFTAERAVAYDSFESVQFFVIDEFYKIDALEENSDRTVALNQAFYKLRKLGGQFYLLGPSIKQIPDGLERAYRCYFYPTNFTTVVSEQIRVAARGGEIERLVHLCRTLDEPTLVFCSSPSRVNEVARALVNAKVGVPSPVLKPAAEWIGRSFHPDWTLVNALLQGVGMHHGKLPRSLAQYIVRMFNELKLRFLICTSTLIEGVNTKAKNVIIFDNTIARKNIDYFTFNNIRGRSGRMFQHFVGRVYLFHDPPPEGLPFVDFPLFSQSASAPDSLLMQLDPSDLLPAADDRMRPFRDQDTLPIKVLQENSSIDPESQLSLARDLLGADMQRLWLLTWNGVPRGPALREVCSLAWTHLIPSSKKNKGGVHSSAQLAAKLWRLYHSPSPRQRIQDELIPGQYAAKTPDEAVERVLEFDRTWAGFEFPRYLMAVSRIQKAILPRRGMSPGDYSHFASMAESLFLSPVIAALDEYGVPAQIGERIAKVLRAVDDLDVALARFGELDVTRLKLDPFEAEIVLDAQRGL